MENFEKINFDTFLDYFEDANDNGTRIRTDDKERWDKFLTQNEISSQIVREAIMTLPNGSKVCIIERGNNKGLYLYSWNTNFPEGNYSYKYKPLLTLFKSKTESEFTKDEQKAILATLAVITKKDGKITEDEKSHFLKILFKVFNEGEEFYVSALNLGFEKVEVIVKAMSYDKRKKFLKMMWEMAYIDGELHRNEEQFIHDVEKLFYS